MSDPAPTETEGPMSTERDVLEREQVEEMLSLSYQLPDEMTPELWRDRLLAHDAALRARCERYEEEIRQAKRLLTDDPDGRSLSEIIGGIGGSVDRALGHVSAIHDELDDRARRALEDDDAE